MTSFLEYLVLNVLPCVNTLGFLYLIRRARKLTRERRAIEEDAQCRAFVDARIITVEFTEGPIQQEFFRVPARAEKRFEQLNPMDYAGDGRRITRVSISAPFKPCEK